MCEFMTREAPCADVKWHSKETSDLLRVQTEQASLVVVQPQQLYLALHGNGNEVVL